MEPKNNLVGFVSGSYIGRCSSQGVRVDRPITIVHGVFKRTGRKRYMGEMKRENVLAKEEDAISLRRKRIALDKATHLFASRARIKP